MGRSSSKTTKKNSKSRANTPEKPQKSMLQRELERLLWIALTLILVMSLHTNRIGAFGLWVRSFLIGVFGNAGYVLPYVMLGVVLITNSERLKGHRTRWYLMLVSFFTGILIFTSVTSHDLLRLYLEDRLVSSFSLEGIGMAYGAAGIGTGGGVVGMLLAELCILAIGKFGYYVMGVLAFIMGGVLAFNVSLTSYLGDQTVQAAKAVKPMADKFKPSFEPSHQVQGQKTPFKKFDSDIYFEADAPAKALDYVEKIKFNDGHLEPEILLPKKELSPEVKAALAEIASSGPKYPIKDSALKEFNSKEPLEKEAGTSGHGSKSPEVPVNSHVSGSESSKLELIPEKLKKPYKMPPLSLLSPATAKVAGNRSEIIENAKRLESTLMNFGVEAKVIEVSRGPAITMYEMSLSPGVKVSKVNALSDDIALALAASQVRIIAPIPGKSAIGIEIPNKDTTMVTFREILESPEYKKAESKMSFGLGKDISGRVVIGDLSKMPHLLVAGATGSGKSVCINTIIQSILYNATPEDVRLLMIDPKVVELSHYNGIPHLILPVVTDPKKASVALNWAVQEMTNRYKLFADTGVKEIKAYQKKTLENPDMVLMPYIVVIIDELADLMMVAPNQVEDAICRLAQMARAAGIHLIVATQRPSVDVITGLIKANIPSRIAFAVSSQVDSRTILDASGAEKLLGRGDMLYHPVGANKPIRIQGAFVSDDEVEKIVEYIKGQVDEVDYHAEILDQEETEDVYGEADEHLMDAIGLIVDTQQASISMLQRKFRLGYNRAARLIDQMEERGIVGPSMGSKPREVLIDRAQFEEWRR
jgi:S-DNA-T family DNA segregation ATPase FtsK/SpoIIIE